MTGKNPDQTVTPLLIALCAGGTALLWPPLALLVLALLGARVLMRGEARIDFAQMAGPVVASLIVGAFVGLAGAIGVLFVWRVYADTSWSVAEAKRLAMAAGRPAETQFTALAHAWATPFYGVTTVAFTAPHMIAGLPLDLPHVPYYVPLAAGVIAAGGLFDWGLQRAADWRLGELATAPAAHLLSHHIVFALGFGLMIDVSAGVFALMAWRLVHAAPFGARVFRPALPAPTT
ncbi:hypothetical protein [Terricaulis silvestris]|uniref:Uncharacterized protein n=1 Tax=Terricaulis silvestris TaxID=2686094 RepID=A0A6I6MMR7_9CAUL|nr:hypothetical protein [Terricaulis silvestris]QGZ94566.1 hypothetical protein DSM104635_01385 [Terricaulis silvestris]